MPLHDWSELSGWEGMHIYWMTALARDLKSRLPAGYRALIGSSPFISLANLTAKPDVAVTQPSQWDGNPATESIPTPDVELPIATLTEETTLLVEYESRIVAAMELISPRNKDRPLARDQYASRYLNYLYAGIHLVLIDVHRRPLGFSFGQAIAEKLDSQLPLDPAPVAVSYRVGEAAAQGGRFLAAWRYPLTVAAPLPRVPLALTIRESVIVDLETTYQSAASDSYLT